MVEIKTYPTSFTYGTREAELVGIPKDVLNLDRWTIELWADFKNARGVALQIGAYYGPNSLSLRPKGNSGNNADVLIRGASSSNWSGTLTLDTLPLDGKCYIAITYCRGIIALYRDGVYKGSLTISDPFNALQTINLGASGALFDSLRISNVARADVDIASIYASLAPFTWDANTTYLQKFDDNLEAVCPFIKTITPSGGSTLADYVDTNNKVHILAVPKYPADGVNASTVYTDYVRLRARACGSKNAKFIDKGKNLVKNPSGKDGFTGWYFIADAKVDFFAPYGMDSSFKVLKSENQWGRISQDVVISPGKTYTLSFWRYAVTDVREAYAQVVIPRASDSVIETAGYSIGQLGVWERVTKTFTVPVTIVGNKVTVQIQGMPKTTNAGWVTALQLEEGSTATEWELPAPQEIYFPGVTQQLYKGNVVMAQPKKYHAEKDGTSLDGSLNNPYLVSGFRVHPGKNSLTLTEESGQGLWKVTARYKPKYY
jgi:hypothetical protein